MRMTWLTYVMLENINADSHINLPSSGKGRINRDLCQTEVDPLCCVLLYLWDSSDGFHLVRPPWAIVTVESHQRPRTCDSQILKVIAALRLTLTGDDESDGPPLPSLPPTDSLSIVTSIQNLCCVRTAARLRVDVSWRVKWSFTSLLQNFTAISLRQMIWAWRGRYTHTDINRYNCTVCCYSF